ncbi:MAG: diguanylate cyclase [Clostridia bacterium]|nr:diguanylate cyclase [Clostridia bacterium]
MKKSRIFTIIRKVLPFIVVFCLLATLFIRAKLSSSNTFIASEVIHYNDEQAEKGFAPTGDKLDVNEIKSSAVMSKVVNRMGLTGIYSVDNLISRISITPLPDADKLAQKEAKLEEGEEYIYEPSTFIVSFAATSDEGPEFARTILDETLDVYFAEYSQKYVNIAPANNTVDKLYDENYDYIEMMELIDDGIDETLTTLYQRMEKNPYYRATSTGASFNDIVDEFNYLRSVKVSSLFARIYKYQLTKNKSVLVSDYTTRIDNNNIANTKETSIVEDIVVVIDAYVTKMRESGNTNITYEYILDNLHERNLTGDNGYITYGDQTVTYDELIYGWRDHNELKEHAIIDSAYCRYVIDTFQKCTGACGSGECQNSDKTCTELHNANYNNMKQEIDEEIKVLVDELTKLYDVTTQTNNEYNEFLGASYISVLSTASVVSSVNVNLYTIIAFFFLVVVCCGGLLVIGRLGDIIHNNFYTDPLTGFANHAYLEKYLDSMKGKILDLGTVFCMIEITNLPAINEKHTRKSGDEVLKMLARFMKNAFGKSGAEFVRESKGNFLVMANSTKYDTVRETMDHFKRYLDEREEFAEVQIEYKVGIAEAAEGEHTALKLLTEAARDKKPYVSEAK